MAVELQPIAAVVALVRVPVIDMPQRIVQMSSSLNEANLFMSMHHLFTVVGAHDFACEMQSKALERSVVYRIAGAKTPSIRLLALMTPGAANKNTPLDYLLEDSDIQLDLLYLLPGKPLPCTFPDHDIAMVALCALRRLEAGCFVNSLRVAPDLATPGWKKRVRRLEG